MRIDARPSVPPGAICTVFLLMALFRSSLSAFLPPISVGIHPTPLFAIRRTAHSLRCCSTAPHKSKKKKPRKPKNPGKTSKGELSNVGTVRPLINWYPGHIAKAERALKESIKSVDVVIEVRDSRAPISTAHPNVREWIGPNKNHIIALSKADLCSQKARTDWKRFYQADENSPTVRFIDGKKGTGINELKKLAISSGDHVNDKRASKGLLPRSVRALVIGYPNVGKSALINRLVGRKAAKSANIPGVTRQFQWVRLAHQLDLLDMPGIIPMNIKDQKCALRLCMCDDIGHAAYDRQIVAAHAISELTRVARSLPGGYFNLELLEKRFKTEMYQDDADISGDEFLHLAAEKCHNGDLERTAARFFTEFRRGDLGPVALESPPDA